jgi:hypothetical protein
MRTTDLALMMTLIARYADSHDRTRRRQFGEEFFPLCIGEIG